MDNQNAKKIEKILANINFRANTDDDKFVIPEVITQNMYQIDKIAQFADKKKRNIVIDGGAHIGSFSLMADAFIPNAEIHSFEPQVDNFNLLKQNSSTNIKPMQLALGVEDGSINLYNTTAVGKSGRFTTTKEEGNEHIADDYTVVEQISTRKFLEKFDRIFILKLDLEGAEAEILNSLPIALLKKVDFILIEQHHIWIDIDRILKSGFLKFFHPLNIERHYALIRDTKSISELQEIHDLSLKAAIRNTEIIAEELRRGFAEKSLINKVKKILRR